jgi:TetR/AcrR family transcriptional regulator, regulator of cefoperazone and chloramphenicol sensitivity
MTTISDILPTTEKSRRKERRIEKRRNQIISAAATVFADKGYQRATTREIADKAEVSEGLIYTYFENKDHLLLAILEKLANSGFDEFTFEHADLALNEDILSKTLQIRHQFLDENDSMMRATMGEAINNQHFREHYFEIFVKPAIETMEKELQNWMDSGDIQITKTPIASRFLLAEIIGLFFLRATEDPFVSKHWQDKEFLQEISEYFLNGLKSTR